MGKQQFEVTLVDRGANPKALRILEERLGGDPAEVVPYVVSTESTKKAAEVLQRQLVAEGAIVTIQIVEIVDDELETADNVDEGGWSGPRMSSRDG